MLLRLGLSRGDVLPRDPQRAGARSRAGPRRRARARARRADARTAAAVRGPLVRAAVAYAGTQALGAARLAFLSSPLREEVRPDRVLGSHRPGRVGREGSAGAGHGARRRAVADRRGGCLVRVSRGDARTVRDALRRGRALGVGTPQSAPARGPRAAARAAPRRRPPERSSSARAFGSREPAGPRTGTLEGRGPTEYGHGFRHPLREAGHPGDAMCPRALQRGEALFALVPMEEQEASRTRPRAHHRDSCRPG